LLSLFFPRQGSQSIAEFVIQSTFPHRFLRPDLRYLCPDAVAGFILMLSWYNIFIVVVAHRSCCCICTLIAIAATVCECTERNSCYVSQKLFENNRETSNHSKMILNVCYIQQKTFDNCLYHTFWCYFKWLYNCSIFKKYIFISECSLMYYFFLTVLVQCLSLSTTSPCPFRSASPSPLPRCPSFVLSFNSMRLMSAKAPAPYPAPPPKEPPSMPLLLVWWLFCVHCFMLLLKCH